MTKKEYQRLCRFILDAETNICTAKINFKIRDQEYELERSARTHHRLLRIRHTYNHLGWIANTYTEDLFPTLQIMKSQWNHIKMVRYSYIDCAPDIASNICGRSYHVENSTSIIYF